MGGGGGFDSFRFENESVINIPFAQNDQKLFTIRVKNVSSSMSGSLSSSNFDATIDPGVAYMWLPSEVCDAFASTFDLDFNSSTQLYIIKESVHEKNIAEQTRVNFTICNADDTCTELTFPYTAFALNASYPLIPTLEPKKYFPMKRANNSGQYTLGRAFLQETHLFAD